MALVEQDIVFTGKDASGNTVIQMPITRAKNVEDLIELVYPVGSIYMSVAATNPATLFGGTWEALDDGRVLIGANSTYTAGSTGGEASHTLTTAEMPSHTHSGSTDSAGAHTHTRGTMDITGSLVAPGISSSFYDATGAFTPKGSRNQNDSRHYSSNGAYNTVNFIASNTWTGSTSSAGAHTHTISLNNAGGGNAHNNMQPYLAVYMWKRTA